MSVSFERSVIDEVTKKALKDIDTTALAAKLKPVLMKKLEKDMLDHIENNFYWDNVFEAVADDIEHIAIQTIRTALGVKPKPVAKPTPTKRGRK